jgi:hypothetical protein
MIAADAEAEGRQQQTGEDAFMGYGPVGNDFVRYRIAVAAVRNYSLLIINSTL